MNADLIIKNGTVITMDPQESFKRWVAVRDGKIIATGGGDDCPYDSEKVIDLGGKTMLPGLFDSHLHCMFTGIRMASVEVSGIGTLKEILHLVDEECAKRPEGEWVFFAGFIEQLVEELRHLNRWELDEVSHGHPVFIIDATNHGLSVNSPALDICNIPPDTPGVEKDENGQATGVFLSDESVFEAFTNIFDHYSEEKIFSLISNCTDFAVTKGVTTMVGIFGKIDKKDTDMKIVMKNLDRFAVNMVPLYQTWDVEQVKAYNLPRIGGCLALDGSTFQYTMAASKPYGEPSVRGMLYFRDDEIYRLVSKAHAEGIQCAFHAIGDRAIDQLIYIYRQVIQEQGQKGLRHRIEHFCLPTDEQMDMAVELGLVLSMQPAFPYLWDLPEGGMYEFLMDRERADRMEPFHEIVKRGGIICGGSDSPVTSIDPLLGIASCIHNPNPIRNISVTEALKVFTINGAYSVHLEESKGSIEVGKDADFTVVDRNPYDYPDSEEIYKMQAVMTIRDGKVVYQR